MNGPPEPVRFSPRPSRPVLWIVTVLMTACSDPSESNLAGWAGSADTIQGVPIVRNPDAPLFSSSDVSLSLLWSAESDIDGRGDIPFEAPTNLVIGEGTVFLLDRPAGRVFGLDAATGALRWSAGQQGEGPGEFSAPTGMAFHQGELVILDTGKKTAEHYSVDGEHLGSDRIEAVLFAVRSLDENGLLLALFGQEDATPLRIRDPEGNFRNFPLPSSVGAPAEIVEFDDGCSAATSWSGTHVVYSLCAGPYVNLLDLNGNVVRGFTVDRGIRERTDEEVEATLDDVRTTMADMDPVLAETMIDMIREQRRYHRDFRRPEFDEAGRYFMLWEQPGQDFGIKPATVLLFSEPGVYLARVTLSESWLDYALVDNTLYTLVQDDLTGLASVKAYRMEFSEEMARALEAPIPSLQGS